MFCDGCGSAVQAGQGFCSRCGKQVLSGIVTMLPRRGRVQEHIHLVGILWLALSAMNALGGVVLLILANTLFTHLDAPGFLRPLLCVIAFFVLFKSLAGFIAGWGLVQRERWARVVALALSFVSLFNVPFGTAVAVYTMWVLLATGAEDEYEALVTSRAA